MNRTAIVLGTAIASIGLAACQAVDANSAPQSVSAGSRMNDHALAQAACGGCHSVESHGLSPNPAAPEFPTIANRRGLTRDTLRSWLSSAHNYPEEMDFYLEDDEIDQLVRYILTLEESAYEPPIQ